MLLAAIDENHRGTYDFIYLPIDFKVEVWSVLVNVSGCKRHEDAEVATKTGQTLCCSFWSLICPSLLRRGIGEHDCRISVMWVMPSST
jgi:hypothetical protein